MKTVAEMIEGLQTIVDLHPEWANAPLLGIEWNLGGQDYRQISRLFAPAILLEGNSDPFILFELGPVVQVGDVIIPMTIDPAIACHPADYEGPGERHLHSCTTCHAPVAVDGEACRRGEFFNG